MCEDAHGCNATLCPAFNQSCAPDPYNASLGLGLSEPLDCDDSPSGGVLASPYFQAMVYVMYCAIFLIALMGNGLVCYVVHSCPRMRTVTNLFIVNLAVGDILMTLFCVPFTFVTTLLLQYWPFGRALCSTVSYSQAISVFVSAYTLVAISVDRFMAIMWPLKPRMGKRQAKAIIAGVWLVALLTALPIPLVSRISHPTSWHQACDKGLCQEVWGNEEHRSMYSMCLLVLQYVVPLLVLVFTYSTIAVVVWGKRPPGEAENCRDQRMARSKRKMIKMMVVVVVVFTICWLPLNVLTLVWENNPGIGSWSGLPFLWFAVHWLAMSHSCYNPVIYCWMNSRFRVGFSQALRVCPVPLRYRRSRSAHDHSALHRFNTSTTFVSSRREPQSTAVCLKQLVKSDSALRYRDDQM